MKRALRLFLAALFVLTAVVTACFASDEAALPQDRCCEHTYSYRLQADSYEATETEGGYRHYVCTECGAEYAYETAPTVYTVNPVTNAAVDQDGSTNPYLPLWEHIPDGEPHVFWSKTDGEWRVYIYGSHETMDICGNDHVTWSAPVYDLSDWRYDGEILRITEEDSASTETVSEETASEEAASEETASDESASSDIFSGFSFSVGTLFAPDCTYDVYTDAWYLAAFEVGNSRCAVYRSTAPDADFGAEEPIYVFTTGVPTEEGEYSCTDPAIIFVDGVMYVGGNISVDSMPEETQTEIYANGCEEDSFAVIYRVEPDENDVWAVTAVSTCPTENAGYLPVMEGISLRYMDDYDSFVMVYYNSGASRTDGAVKDSAGLAYVYTDDLMDGVWHYGENGFGDNVIHDNNGYYVKNASGEMTLSETATNNGMNNHGGIVKINGTWYIFGHRCTTSGYRQSICEKLSTRMEDGVLYIDATELTSSGAAESLDAAKTWDAGIACYLTGGPAITAYTGNHEADTNENIDWDVSHYAPVYGIVDGSVVGYKYLDFGETPAACVNLLVMQQDGSADGTAYVYIDAPSAEQGGTCIGSVEISAAAIEDAYETETGTDGTVWSWLCADLDVDVTGVHGVYFVFSSQDSAEICRMDALRFGYISEGRACEHTYDYVLQDDSYEATDDEGGYRHYVCTVCGAEYAYETDPLVYVDGYVKQDGTIVEVNEDASGSMNPNLPLWEHIPDAEPHVFWSKADCEWRVYIYGSHDTGDIICGQDQVVWSAPVYDLSDWRFDGQVMDVYEKEGGSDLKLNALFAPDVDYDVQTDTYYMMTFEVFDAEVLRRAVSADARYDLDDSVVYSFCMDTGWGPYVTTDPAVYIEDGTIYVIASAAVGDLSDPDYVSQLYAAEGLQEELDLIAAAGETSSQFAVICQMKADPSEGVETLHYCSLEGKGYLPIMEGVSLRYDSDSGYYIMVYYGNELGDVTTDGQTEGLAYVYTDDLMNGEWIMGDNTFGGNVIYDNNGVYLTDAETGTPEKVTQKTFAGGNNHGGMVKANGQWYIFGHITDGTHRMNTIEKIELIVNEDGSLTIPAVEMTSSGAADALDAFEPVQAGTACYIVPGLGMDYEAGSSFGFDENGSMVIYDDVVSPVPMIRSYEANTVSSHNYAGLYDMTLTHVSPMTNITDGDILGYKYLDFGENAAQSIRLLVSRDADNCDGSVTVWLDAPCAEDGGTAVGTIELSASAAAAAQDTETGSDGTLWTWLGGTLDESVSGTHAVYLVFSADTADTEICELDSFVFG